MAAVSRLSCFLFFVLTSRISRAQTEGDTGYDYEAAYDDDDDTDNDESGYEPSFDVPIVNVTVVTGQTAVLPCSIDYLGKYKVAWLDHKSIPLTYEDRRVIDDFRFGVVRPNVKEWNLQIRDIKWEDQGQYRCTINTNPVKSKMVMLHVKVPAGIIDESSSGDATVQEGDTVVLVCNVTGVPRPEVQWYRRPALSKMSDRERIPLTGEMIIIQNVSRYCDDFYECVASNGVPPSVSRQMRVTVEFKPEITLPNRRLGQTRGKETILECVITAYPQAEIYWEKNGKKIVSNAKYRMEAYDEGDNTVILSLRISDLQEADYGDYRCSASNSLGDDSETMLLYEYAEQDEKLKSTERHPGGLVPGSSSQLPLSHNDPQHQLPTPPAPRISKPPIGMSIVNQTSNRKHYSTMTSADVSNLSKQWTRSELLFNVTIWIFVSVSGIIRFL